MIVSNLLTNKQASTIFESYLFHEGESLTLLLYYKQKTLCDALFRIDVDSCLYAPTFHCGRKRKGQICVLARVLIRYVRY